MQNYTNSIKIRYTQNAKERLDKAHIILVMSNKLFEELPGIFNQ